MTNIYPNIQNLKNYTHQANEHSHDDLQQSN